MKKILSMKKIFLGMLGLVLTLGLSVPVFAKTAVVIDTLYIDVADVLDEGAECSWMQLCVYRGEYESSNTALVYWETMTKVSDTVYSFDTSSIMFDEDIKVKYRFYDGNTSYGYQITSFKDDKNLWTSASWNTGTWGTYGSSNNNAVIPAGGGKSAEVIGRYVAGEGGDAIYKVDIAWGSMAFTYTGASKGTWSTANHTYQGASAAEWSCENGADQIRVTNHSNAGIVVTPAYAPGDTYKDITVTYSPARLNLATADNGTDGGAGSATSAALTVTPNGALPKNTSNATIGSVTLTLSAISNQTELLSALNAGGKVVLSEDLEVLERKAVNAASLELDLNGHKITGLSKGYISFGNGNTTRTLILCDSVGGGSVTGIIDNTDGEVILNSGTFVGSVYGNGSKSSITINGGTVTGDCLIQENSSQFYMNGGTVEGTVTLTNHVNGTITGGTVKGELKVQGSSDVNISGGIFEGNITVGEATLSITGGTFTQDPSSYVDTENYDVMTNDDGTFTVSEKA